MSNYKEYSRDDLVVLLVESLNEIKELRGTVESLSKSVSNLREELGYANNEMLMFQHQIIDAKQNMAEFIDDEIKKRVGQPPSKKKR